MLDCDQLELTLANARRELLDRRGAHGHWEGELSSSALSTATAILTLALYDRASGSRGPQFSEQIARGASWLRDHQNQDGGWGDTTQSLSNISTTALVWGALSAVAPADEFASTIQRAEVWLQQAAGGVDVDHLVPAILRRYGKDRTFSVPILTHLALAGQLGSGRNAWRHVPQLPFELAIFPHAWFKTIRLPVVSYALPALIAIGQVRHKHRPTRNPVLRAIRRLSIQRTLRVLEQIQPTSGGYLEATPLTSFVCMSLIGAGNHTHPVVQQGLKFLVRSMRDDGSWPIDTNLATWVTTLSTGALAAADSELSLSPSDQQAISNWLLAQQYRVQHPYTDAAPGGWAWTDLPGGVPDADDTPGALLALKHLQPDDAEARRAAAAGIGWLLDLQNRDGGIPTFCRGWGALPFDRSSADLTAHALRAMFAWHDAMDRSLQSRMQHGVQRGLKFLLEAQQPSGAWAPLWFGNQHAPDEVNLTYGTSRVLRMLADVPAGQLTHQLSEQLTTAAARAISWLVTIQNQDGGWGGADGTPSSIEETALAIESLAVYFERDFSSDGASGLIRHSELRDALIAGTNWLIMQTQHGRQFPNSPIGFYFAKLWYFEQLYPIVYTVAALGHVQRISTDLGVRPSQAKLPASFA